MYNTVTATQTTSIIAHKELFNSNEVGLYMNFCERVFDLRLAAWQAFRRSASIHRTQIFKNLFNLSRLRLVTYLFQVTGHETSYIQIPFLRIYFVREVKTIVRFEYSMSNITQQQRISGEV